MRYILTAPLNAHIRVDQREKLEKIKFKIEKEQKMKIPLSEIVRMALDVGFPILEQNNESIMELLKK